MSSFQHLAASGHPNNRNSQEASRGSLGKGFAKKFVSGDWQMDWGIVRADHVYTATRRYLLGCDTEW